MKVRWRGNDLAYGVKYLERRILIKPRPTPADLPKLIALAENDLVSCWLFNRIIAHSAQQTYIKLRHLSVFKKCETNPPIPQESGDGLFEASDATVAFDRNEINKILMEQSELRSFFWIDNIALSRLYIICLEGVTLITDEAKFSLRLAKLLNLSVCDEQIFFWMHTRTTHAPATIFDGLLKLPAGFGVETGVEGTFLVPNESWFEQKDNRGQSSVDDDLLPVMERVVRRAKKKSTAILMFSGGTDSMFLAHALREAEVKFDLVYFHPRAVDANVSALRTALIGAEKLGLALDVRLVDLPTAYDCLERNIDTFLLDRHASLLHIGGFGTMQDVPRDALIFNGQSSDSIFAFGPSNLTFQDFLRRLLMTPMFRWSLFLVFPFIKKIFNIDGLSWPITSRQQILAASFFERYIFAHPLRYQPSDAVKEVIDFNVGRSLNFTDRIFMGKQNFIQGSDGQVVVQSARLYNFYNINMPFCDQNIVRFANRNRKRLRDLIYPKSFIRRHSRKINETIDFNREYVDKVVDDIINECKTSNVSMCLYMDKVRYLFIERMRVLTNRRELNWESNYPLPI